jgi:hypothetical protein
MSDRGQRRPAASSASYRKDGLFMFTNLGFAAAPGRSSGYSLLDHATEGHRRRTLLSRRHVLAGGLAPVRSAVGLAE